MTGGEVEHYRRELGYPESMRDELRELNNNGLFGKIGYEGRIHFLLIKFRETKSMYLELEALLGSQYQRALDDVWKCITDYQNSVDMVVRANGIQMTDEDRKVHLDRVYAPINQESDVFGIRIHDHIEKQVANLRDLLISTKGPFEDLI